MIHAIAMLMGALAAPAASVSDVPSRTLGEHAAVVEHVAIEPKGKLVATADAEGALKVWKLKKGELVRETATERGGLAGLGLSAKGALMYGEPGLPTISFHEAGEDEPVVAATVTPKVVAMAADPKARWGWLGCDDGWVYRLDPSGGREVVRREFKNDGVTRLVSDAAGKWLAVGGVDGSVRLLAADDCERGEKLRGHTGPVRGLGFDATGKTLVTGGDDTAVHVWDPRSGEQLRSLDGHEAAVGAVAVATKTKWIATGDDAGRILIWGLKKGEQLLEIDTGEAPVTALAFTPDGKTLACLNGGTTVVLYDVAKAL